MHQSLRRGLAALEAVAAGHGTAAELGAILGVDKSTVSRLLATLEADSWVIREDGRAVPGPRVAVLGVRGPYAGQVSRARTLVDAVASATQVDAMATMLVDATGFVLASAQGVGIMDYPPIVGTFPIWTTAIGHALASMLDHEAVAALLAGAPGPPADVGSGIITGGGAPLPTAELRRRIAEARDTGRAIEYGEFDPAVGCVAVPWPHRQGGRPSALGCIGPLETIRTRRRLIETALRAAATPGATRASVRAACVRNEATARRM